jgi:hypothetical protein
MADRDYIINSHLKELHGSTFEIVRGEPDITGWKVIGLNNREIGKVHDLIFDEIAYRVKYVIVDVNGKPLNLVSRLVLVPIELVELLTSDKVVVVSGLTVGHLASLPTYEKDKITTNAEHSIGSVFNTVPEPVHAENTAYDRSYQPQPRDREEKYYRPKTEVVARASKDEIKEEIHQVKDKVKKIEDDLDRL